MNKKRFERPGTDALASAAGKPSEPSKVNRAPDIDDSSPRHVVSSDDTSVGMITHDDLGQARWTWATEVGSTSGDIEDTFNLLKALDNDALALADETEGQGPASTAEADPAGGYNPYDTVNIKIPPRLRKP